MAGAIAASGEACQTSRRRSVTAAVNALEAPQVVLNHCALNPLVLYSCSATHYCYIQPIVFSALSPGLKPKAWALMKLSPSPKPFEALKRAWAWPGFFGPEARACGLGAQPGTSLWRTRDVSAREQVNCSLRARCYYHHTRLNFTRRCLY